MTNLEEIRHILVIEEPKCTKTFYLERPTYSLGRHSENDIVIDSQRVSRHHATLLRRTDVKTNYYSYWILDGDLQGNRSRNGIFINDKKCLVHELKDGDFIRFSAEVSAKYCIDSSIDIDDRGIEDSDLILAGDSVLETNYIASTNSKTVPVSFSKNFELEPLASSSHSYNDLNPIPIIEIDFYGSIVYYNQAAKAQLKNIEIEQKNHSLSFDLIDNFNKLKSSPYIRQIIIDGRVFEQTSYCIPESKIIRSYLLEKSQEKYLEQTIQEKDDILKIIYQQTDFGVIILDVTSRKAIDANYSCLKILGYSLEKIIDSKIYKLFLEEDKLEIIFQKIITERRSFEGDLVFRNVHNYPIDVNLKIEPIGITEVKKLCLIFQKKSIDKKNLCLPGSEVKSIDSNGFKQHLLTAIANAKRNQKLLAVIALGIEHYTEIVQLLSTEENEILISRISERLRACLRSGDTTTHWEEEKFLLLMPQIGAIEEVAKIGQRVHNTFREFFKIGDRQLNLEVKLGIAIYPQDGQELDLLIANSDVALYRAKSTNNTSYQFYNPIMNSQASVMLQLEHLLQKALEKDEFILHYQPQIDIKSGEIQGVEALLRWQHPELGLVLPDSFLKLAEQTGLIIPIGEWVLRTACQQNKLWQTKGLPPLRIAVNISPLQFQQPNLVAKIEQVLEETQLEASLLELEIAAATLMENVDYASQTLAKLKKIGVNISMDSLAAGFSSLDYLKKLSFDTLKIDRSFVKKLTQSNQDIAIVSALISLGRGFNLKIVAEGVETKQQIELLRRLKCDRMQGFWFSRPLPAEDATKLLPFNYEEEVISQE
jgi:diguanylate cyclase (GGDEF)-like protein